MTASLPFINDGSGRDSGSVDATDAAAGVGGCGVGLGVVTVGVVANGPSDVLVGSPFAIEECCGAG